jgi:ribosomal protein S18 acetylase RimI-like enzyme
MPVRLAHVNLPARDPVGLARWYAERFDLEQDGAFAFAPGTLLVFEPGGPQGPRAGGHFGFEVASRAEVARFADRFGCEPEVEEDYVGFKAHDPEGNRFEVYFEERAARAPDVRPLAAADGPWLRDASAPVGGLEVVSRGALHRLPELPGFVAELGGVPLGFACYRPEGESCELVAIRALRERRGVGSALVGAVETAAARAGARRLWLITTNDNVGALRFYQLAGFRLVAVHLAAVDRARVLKPSIPLVGVDGIPCRDELELEKRL